MVYKCKEIRKMKIVEMHSYLDDECNYYILIFYITAYSSSMSYSGQVPINLFIYLEKLITIVCINPTVLLELQPVCCTPFQMESF